MLRQNFYTRNDMNISDSKFINLEEYYEVEYWSKKFDITPELLQRAVKDSGSTEAEQVEKYIRKTYFNK